MAKADEASFVEKHIEKVILGAAAVLLILAAMRWVLSSPVTLELIPPTGRGRPQPVAPVEADTVLLDAARSVRGIHDRSSYQPAPLPKYANRIASLGAIAPIETRIDLGTPRRPVLTETVTIIEAGPKLRLKDLVALLPAPPAPKVAANIEVPETAQPDDRVVAHGALTYPFLQVRKAWNEEVARKKVENVIVRTVAKRVVIEAQQRLPDGSWGPPKPVRGAIRLGEDGKPPALTEIPPFDGKNHQAVRDARDALGRPVEQGHILQPDYYRIWNVATGWGDWKAHLPEVGAADPNATKIHFHDDTTMRLSETYRYRVKLVLVNPLLTYDTLGKDAQAQQDARTPEIETPFSPWSEPVSVARRVDFFLTGNNPMTREMILTVYAYKWGQTVAQSFRVKPGMPIGGPKKVAVRPIGGAADEAQEVEVDFSTGAIVLECDFAYKILERGVPLTTSKLIYLDRAGAIRSRVQIRDSRDPRRARLEEEVRRSRGG